jgi:hypothetical protein
MSAAIADAEHELKKAIVELRKRPSAAAFWRHWYAFDAFESVWRPLVLAGGVTPGDWKASWSRAVGRPPGPGSASRFGWCGGRFLSVPSCQDPNCKGVACPFGENLAASA